MTDKERAVWLRWAWLCWALNDDEGEPPSSEGPPWWVAAITERQALTSDLAWLRWARGELDAASVEMETSTPVASAPHWAKDILWGRLLRGSASAADIAASLKLDTPMNVRLTAPDWVVAGLMYLDGVKALADTQRLRREG